MNSYKCATSCIGSDTHNTYRNDLGRLKRCTSLADFFDEQHAIGFSSYIELIQHLITADIHTPVKRMLLQPIHISSIFHQVVLLNQQPKQTPSNWVQAVCLEIITQIYTRDIIWHIDSDSVNNPLVHRSLLDGIGNMVECGCAVSSPFGDGRIAQIICHNIAVVEFLIQNESGIWCQSSQIGFVQSQHIVRSSDMPIKRVSDMSVGYWTDVFMGVYKKLWSNEELDSVLLLIICKVTKLFAHHKHIWRIIFALQIVNDTFFSRLCYHSYNPQIASLVHVLMHLDCSLDSENLLNMCKLFMQSFSAYAPSFREEHYILWSSRFSNLSWVLSEIFCGKFPECFSYYIHGKLQESFYESKKGYGRLIAPSLDLELNKRRLAFLQNSCIDCIKKSHFGFKSMLRLSISELLHWDISCSPSPEVLLIDAVTSMVQFFSTGSDVDDVRNSVQAFVPILCMLLDRRSHMDNISKLANSGIFSDSSSEEDDEFDNESLDTIVPLKSTLLILSVSKLINALIGLGDIKIDTLFAERGIFQCLLNLFVCFDTCSILHAQIVKIILSILDAKSQCINGVLLRSLFIKGQYNVLEFIVTAHDRRKQDHSSHFRPYLALVGVQIDRICSSPTLAQEVVRQYCQMNAHWLEFRPTLLAKFYRDSDKANPGIPCNQSIPSVLPCKMDTQSFGSSTNSVYTGQVQPRLIRESRSNSKLSLSPCDFHCTEAYFTENKKCLSGILYRKESNWVKFEISYSDDSNILQVLKLPNEVVRKQQSTVNKLRRMSSSFRRIKHGKRRSYVVCDIREWISFGFDMETPNHGFFGFQIDGFQLNKEEDETLTFATNSKEQRQLWIEFVFNGIIHSRKQLDSLPSPNEKFAMIKDQVLGAPNVDLNAQKLPTGFADNFVLKSELPEDIPFWGKFYRWEGFKQYLFLFHAIVDIFSVKRERIFTSGYSVILEFKVILLLKSNQKKVECRCTDTYLFNSEQQITLLTRTIMDSEKLSDALCCD